MVPIPKLELHVAHACNLACESCSHYSNHAHKGVLAPELAEEWMSAWSPRIAPRVVTLLGGEPTLNPRLAEYLPMVRRHWPGARVRLVTNGFFLHRHPTLPAALAAHGNAVVSVSIHHGDPSYVARLQPVMELLRGWVRDHCIQARVDPSHTHWTRRYKGYGTEMAPYDDEKPRESWQACPARECMQLFEGSLWKCGPITYLRLQRERYALSPAWDRYLAYRPVRADCSDAELAAFAAREDEDCCSMCPAQPERFNLPIPLRRLARSDPAEPAEQGARP